MVFFSEIESLFIEGQIEHFLEEKARKERARNEEISTPRQETAKSPTRGFEESRSPSLWSPGKRAQSRKILKSPKKSRRELDTNERLSIVRRIFEFHKEHHNLDELVKKILKVYSDLMMQSDSLARQ